MLTSQERELLRKVTGAVHNQETFGTVDGPGIRYVFFLQGCPLRCLYCHNPDSTPFAGGEAWTAGQVVDEILRYRPFIKKGGATLSGGEPLAQPEFAAAIVELLKEEGVHTAIDTAGCMSLKIPGVKRAVDLADLILLDIKAIDDAVSRELSGKDSQTAFGLLDYCEEIGKPVWVRQVLLRGYTLDHGQLELLAKKLADYRCVERVELLPFHKLGEHKWAEMGREYLLGEVEATTKEEAEAAREIFRQVGLEVH